MKTKDILGITPYVSGFEHGINEKLFNEKLYVNVKYQNKADEFYKHILKPKCEIHHKVCVVKGYSGCGKSTFIGKLLSELMEDMHLTFKMDLAQSIESIYFFGKVEANKYGKLILGKFYGLLMTALSQILMMRELESDFQYIDRLKRLSLYFISINDSVFSEFGNALKSKLCNTSGQNIRAKIYAFVSNEVLKIINCGIDDLDENEKLIRLIKNALRFLFLIFRGQWVQNKNPDKRFFFVIDSLEHYIAKEKVQDKDIKIIVFNILTDFIDEEDRLDKFRFNGQPSFNDIFKIIIACRQTTFNMISETMDDDDYPDLDIIDISDWYSASDIVKKRKQFFENDIEDMDTMNLIDAILSGSDPVLRDRLLMMHNQNKRRLFSFLCDIILEKKFDIKTQYNKLIANGDKLSDAVKNGARNLIEGWLFYEIKESGYFNKLLTVSNDKDNPQGQSYTRKILTYLQAREFEAVEEEIYIPLYEIVANVFFNGNISDKTFEDISQVIMAMNESDKDLTHWCQLITLKSNEQEIDDDILKKTYSEKNKKYSIKLNSSGRYFLHRMCSYEYFAVRYLDDKYRPLFDSRNFDNGNYKQCLNVIKKVKDMTFKCIDRIIADDKNFFKEEGENSDYSLMYSKRGHLRYTRTGHKITHIESIIDNHISYLDCFRIYIIEYNMDSTKKKEFLEGLIDIITEYCNKMDYILSLNTEKRGQKNWYIERRGDTKKLYYYKENLELAKNNLLNPNMEILKYSLTGDKIEV